MSQDIPGADAPRDATIIRPRPGGGRRPTSPSGQLQAPPPPPSIPLRTPDAPLELPGEGRDFAAPSGGGINPLLQAATPLLILAGQLRNQIENARVDNLYNRSVQEIRSFEDRARRAGTSEEDVLAARYVLCTVVDEAVLNTPWGVASNWSGRSLLLTFHRETFGGAKVFQLVTRILNEPRRHLSLLELVYMCLSLGFEGRYRVEEQGAARLADVRQEVFRCIQTLRGPAEADLSPQWKGVEDRRREMLRIVPLWVVATACVAVLLATFTILNSKLSNRADPIYAQLAAVGRQPLWVPAHVAAEVSSVGLRQLLAPQIARGLVVIQDQPGGAELLTVAVSDLFASGSDSVNPAYLALVNDIGAAAEKVPGRYIVTGHTDDQPLRSFQYSDNFALSRARALQVAGLLKKQIRDPGRVDFVGVGSSEPRFTPANLPQNRARNRRVEIMHRVDG